MVALLWTPQKIGNIIYAFMQNYLIVLVFKRSLKIMQQEMIVTYKKFSLNLVSNIR